MAAAELLVADDPLVYWGVAAVSTSPSRSSAASVRGASPAAVRTDMAVHPERHRHHHPARRHSRQHVNPQGLKLEGRDDWLNFSSSRRTCCRPSAARS